MADRITPFDAGPTPAPGYVARDISPSDSWFEKLWGHYESTFFYVLNLIIDLGPTLGALVLNKAK